MCLSVCGLSKDLDYQKCVKKLVQNGFCRSVIFGITRTFVYTVLQENW